MPTNSETPLKWALIENNQDDVLEVIPTFGREHIHSTSCWCNPHWDTVAERLLIHECEN